jgi:hypothetical protein
VSPLLPLAIALWGALPSDSARPLRRYLLAAASDDGGPGRSRLRFSSDDARGVASVMRGLGGVSTDDAVLLLDADSGRFLSSLETLSSRMLRARDSGVRVELMVYYSGHSDEDGLLLGGTRLSWSRLRRTLEASPAEIRLAVLDACASGAALRSKGGLRRQAFRIEGADRLRGQAFLTSSRAEEASQESDRLRGSFFTHAFLAGLRGAADADGDGKVTLLEAYRYAYDQTVAGTSDTRTGPQHPEFDLDLSGSGDVVLTDLSQAGALLDLPANLSGRLQVSDSSGEVLADVHKTPGRGLSLGLPAGNWRVELSDSTGRRSRRVDLPPGARVAWSPSGSDSVLPPAPAPVAPPSIFGPDDSLRARVAHDEPLDTIPFNLGFLPPASTNGTRSPKALNRLSLDLLVGEAAEIRGVQVAAGIATASRGVHGIQAAAGLARAGRLEGIQAGAVTIADDSMAGGQFADFCAVARKGGRGMQASTVGWIEGDFQGAQAAVVSIARGGRFQGFQAGVIDFASSPDVPAATAPRRFQAAVVAISNGPVSGAQAGVVNIAGHLRGAQMGVVNIADEVDGAQLGVVNIANRVDKAQVGVLNLSDTVRGAAVGVVNLSRSMDALPLGVLSAGLNMRPGLDVWMEESRWAGAALRLDMPHYHVRFAGLDDLTDRSGGFGFGVGFGGHWTLAPGWRVDLDLMSRCIWDLPEHGAILGAQWNTASISVQRLVGPARVFAGVSYNELQPEKPGRADRFVRVPGEYQYDPSGRVRLWPGAFVGLGI